MPSREELIEKCTNAVKQTTFFYLITQEIQAEFHLRKVQSLKQAAHESNIFQKRKYFQMNHIKNSIKFFISNANSRSRNSKERIQLSYKDKSQIAQNIFSL